jgi:hypothetical protein
MVVVVEASKTSSPPSGCCVAGTTPTATGDERTCGSGGRDDASHGPDTSFMVGRMLPADLLVVSLRYLIIIFVAIIFVFSSLSRERESIHFA